MQINFSTENMQIKTDMKQNKIAQNSKLHNNTFTGMPRMQKLFEEVIGNGKRTESSAEGSWENPSPRRMETERHGSGKDHGDIEGNTISVSEKEF